MPAFTSIRRTVESFREVGWRRRALIAEAVAWLLVLRFALLLVPFPRLARALGAFVPPADPRVAAAGAATTQDAAWLAREIGWAGTRGAAHAPFKAVCLPQAMAARIMLKRRGVGSVMRFGAARSPGSPLVTHVWLDAAGVKVTGYPAARGFAEIGCFV
jgi:Transglutaminase-like superfamily